MGLADLLTGGAGDKANSDLSAALAAIQGVQNPTAAQLTLPELQKYVVAGIITPAQAQAYLQKNNALATENTAQIGTAAQIAALNQLSGIADAGAAGTPTEQAQQAQTIQQMNEAVGGQRGAIEQAAEARGTPGALVQAALENQTVGQEGQQAYQNALQSQSQAYQTALNAMTQGAGVGQALQGQQNTQANTVAAAQNAMQQFNAANQQASGEANAARAQQAAAANAAAANTVAGQNTQAGNERLLYNAQVPETVFNNNLGKAQAQAGINEAQANAATQQGQQEAGLWSGLIGAGATLGSGAVMGNTLGKVLAAQQAAPVAAAPNTTFGGSSTNFARGGIISDHAGCYHDGGICMEKGGMVPGKPNVPGNSLRNDTVAAHLSPGEAVLPRTAVQAHMPEVLGLLSEARRVPPPEHHPADVATLLKAMKAIRTGAA